MKLLKSSNSVKFYCVKPEYKASWEKEPTGKLTGNLKINFDSPDAWTVFGVCEGGFVRSGHHYLPLFKGDLTGCIQHLHSSGYSLDNLQGSYQAINNKDIDTSTVNF